MPSTQVPWPDVHKKIDDLEKRGSMIVAVVGDTPGGVLIVWRTPKQQQKYETRSRG